MSPFVPPRLAGFAYRGPCLYFVTICAASRQRIFEDAAMAAWIAGQISRCFESRQLAVIAYCVMPDHVHLVLEGTTDEASLPAAIRAWKQETSFAWTQRTGSRLWQRGFYDRVLREQDSLPAVVRYVVENPVRAGLVEDPACYPWIGSSRYTMNELREAGGDWRPR